VVFCNIGCTGFKGSAYLCVEIAARGHEIIEHVVA
jgi:hypothetical protein